MPKLLIQDAAEILGLSRDTIRRKLRAGELKGEKRPVGRVQMWFVDLDDEQLPRRYRAQRDVSDEHGQRVAELLRDRDAWRDQAVKLLENNETLGRVISNMEIERGK